MNQKRIKVPQAGAVIGTLAEADAALARLAELRRDLALIEAGMNEAIDALKQTTALESAPYIEQVQALETGLMVYASYHKAELFHDRRSRELDHGIIGWRLSTELHPRPKWTWAMVLGQLKVLKMDEAIRQKEEVNRDVLREWPEERLDIVGARRIQKDTFFLELKQEELAEV